MVYLQNETAGYLGNSPVFWSKHGGYTQWLDDATQFTVAEANVIIRGSRGTHRWKKHSVKRLDKLARRTVDVQDMRRKATPSRPETKNG